MDSVRFGYWKTVPLQFHKEFWGKVYNSPLSLYSLLRSYHDVSACSEEDIRHFDEAELQQTP